ncbi:MAG: aminotransferase class V-fold PLP-dependent enzyme [Saprospiraceae bacterium]|nr:aminotransferase class V-fold PLP-dependent enzyme [Saprospiraceae bacterium]
MSETIHRKLQDELHSAALFHQVMHGIRAYLGQVEHRHVYPAEQALTSLAVFDEPLANEPVPAAEIIRTLTEYGAPATVASVGGRYYGFVTGSVIPAGMAAKQLATAWDQNSAMQVLSPVCAKLESVVESWLTDLFGLPAGTVAGFVSGTSMANVCGLAAARYRLLERQGWDVNRRGLPGAPALRVVTGRHAHSTVLKAISLLGLGQDRIEWVDVDEQGRIDPEALPQLDDRTLLILQAGNVNSGAFDDVETIAERISGSGAWIHIDGAFGLWAAAAELLRDRTTGIARADSWAVDAHKTLNAPYDSGIVLCRDKEALVSALHMQGGYIVLGERDGMFTTPEMSRRSRIIELWATLKSLGRQGIDDLVTGLYARALQFAEEIRAIDGFAVVNEVVFNQVLVQCADDELTDRVIARIQELRTCWVGGSEWFGRRVIRVSICAWTTTPEDITRSVASFAQAIEDVSAPGN